MRARQLRLSSLDSIKKNVPGLINKKLNIVLSDQTVILGELKSIESDGLLVKNMRLKKIHLPYTYIAEIIFDINT